MSQKLSIFVVSFTLLLSVSSGALADLWWPDIPPASPESKTDEFDGVSLDGKWSEWDPASFMTVTLDAREALKLSGSSADHTRWGGIYQPVPNTTEYAIYAKLSVRHDQAWSGGALFVSQNLDSSPSTADFRTAEVLWSVSSAMRWDTRTYASYTDETPTSVVSRAQQPAAGYVRIRMNGTTCATDFSSDGIGWANFSTVTLGFTPTHFGVAFNVHDDTDHNTAGPGWLLVDFVRVFSGNGTSDFDGTKIGGFL